MSLKRLVLGFAALLISLPCLSSSLADRSPFAQGHWWDATRAGSGFELFNASGEAMVIWYTFETDGRPVWYTAQGPVSSIGTQSWPLLKHSWANGRKGGYSVVGSLRLNLRHPESADVAWTIGNFAGNWSIQPFVASGIQNEIDHSGSYFDPLNSGWGLTLTEQGDVLGGVLYTYDATGAPTWAAGFDRGARGSVQFITASGACPVCAYRANATQNVGRLTFEFTREWEMTLRNGLNLPMAAGVNVDGARVVQLGRPVSLRKADRELASFHSEQALKTYLDAGMFNVERAYTSAGVDFSAAPPAGTPTEFSSTNLQEAGVDEADFIKSNGRHVYTYAHNASGARQPVVRIARIGDYGSSLETLGSVALASGPSSPMDNAGLYLHGDKLISVTGTLPIVFFGSPWMPTSAWAQGVTQIEIMNAANPEMPVSQWRARIDGHIVSSRRIGDRLYVVSRFIPGPEGFVFGGSNIAANQAILARTPLSAMLPHVSANGSERVPAVALSDIYAPPQGGRRPIADMILITAIDLATPRIAQTLAIVGAVETIYSSTQHLYLASSRYELRNALGGLLPVEPPAFLTDLHQIRLTPEALSIVGSGTVEGFLGGDIDKAAFRLSEHQGRLRAVTSSTNFWGPNRNRLTILEPSTVSPGLLKTVSYLPNAQRPQTLGKPNELLYGTRFLGDRLYAVTFRMVDPLYVVDLSNAADPKITGELVVPGFSEYLHPLPNGLLLGFGKDATEAGLFQGLQLSLYDVRDAGQPREMQRVLLGKRGSESALLRHHHAFSGLLRPDGMGPFAFPARIHDGQSSYGWYPWKESGLMRFELRGLGASDAKLVQMPSLITHRAETTAALPFDAAVNGARSILYRDGTVYIANGQFWRQDSMGTAFGPF